MTGPELRPCWSAPRIQAGKDSGMNSGRGSRRRHFLRSTAAAPTRIVCQFETRRANNSWWSLTKLVKPRLTDHHAHTTVDTSKLSWTIMLSRVFMRSRLHSCASHLSIIHQPSPNQNEANRPDPRRNGAVFPWQSQSQPPGPSGENRENAHRHVAQFDERTFLHVGNRMLVR